MKKIIMGALIALILFVILLLALAPAKVATPWISDVVPGVSFTNIKGSIWSMEADSIQYRQLKLRNVSLSTSPLPLFIGTLNSDLAINDPEITLNSKVSLSQGNYEIYDTSFNLNTSYVANFVRLPVKGLAGNISGKVMQAHILQRDLQTESRRNSEKELQIELIALEGEGKWQNAVIEYTNNNLELGDIYFSVSKIPETNSAKLKIIENQGVLDLKGYIDVSLNKRFNMKLNTTASLPPNIKSWLATWGREQNGRILLEWQGQLP